jgi:predicted DsbA family dithiol-disulfide isomerase
MHDQLFVHQSALDATSLVDYADGLGLDRRQFTSCLKSESAALKEDIAEAKRAGVESTPTFVIGAIQGNGDLVVSTRIRGAQPLQVLRNAIETALKASAHQRAS